MYCLALGILSLCYFQAQGMCHALTLQNAQMLDAWDRNALMLAAHRLDHHAVEAMARSAATNHDWILLATTKDIHGYTALLSALEYSASDNEEMIGDCKNPQIKIMNHLLHIFRSDVNAKNNAGMTPLMLAVMKNNAPAVELLLAFNARVDEQDMQGTSALMIAARNDDTSLLEKLLQAGAQVAVRDTLGKTALDYASDNSEVQQLLFVPPVLPSAPSLRQQFAETPMSNPLHVSQEINFTHSLPHMSSSLVVDNLRAFSENSNPIYRGICRVLRTPSFMARSRSSTQ